MIVDTHIHIWDLQKVRYSWLDGNKTILNRSYSLDELEPQRQEAGITQGVLVQAANNLDDTKLMIDAALQHSWITGVVGWLPLLEPEETKTTIDNFWKQQPLCKGVRHLVHDEPDPQWVLQPAVIESLQLLAQEQIPFDFVGVTETHLETAIALAKKNPALRIVLDHLNQPPTTEPAFGRWSSLIKEAATHQNIFAKISGLGTATQKGTSWNERDIRQGISVALEAFGADRCFMGGDWPVSLLAGGYVQTWTYYQHILNELVTDAHTLHKIFYQNAIQFYDL